MKLSLAGRAPLPAGSDIDQGPALERASHSHFILHNSPVDSPPPSPSTISFSRFHFVFPRGCLCVGPGGRLRFYLRANTRTPGQRERHILPQLSPQRRKSCARGWRGPANRVRKIELPAGGGGLSELAGNYDNLKNEWGPGRQ